MPLDINAAPTGTPATAPAGSPPLLAIEDLRTYFHTDAGLARAVDGISLTIDAGRTLALVGESGSGKTVTALSVLQLIPRPPGEFVSGAIRFEGRDLLQLSVPAMRKVRGAQISMIFQEPATSLNPVFTIGNQLAETLRLHRGLKGRALREAAIQALQRVRVTDAERRLQQYPHELSGGMKQRVMIAMALSCRPRLLIADEPTTAVDVTIQARILELLRQMQAELGMAILLITHDLGVVAELADDVAVMYAGQVVEHAPVAELFANPLHPYTVGLFNSLPRIDRRMSRLESIEGTVPAPTNFPAGCRFRERCRFATARCLEPPPLVAQALEHLVACWHTDRVIASRDTSCPPPPSCSPPPSRGRG